jgi:phosphatidylglycerophosphatase A
VPPTAETGGAPAGSAAARPRPTDLPLGPRLLATFGGTGLLRPGPGTWTSAAAALPLLFVPSSAYPYAVAAAAVLAYALCVLLATRPSLRPVIDRDPGWFTLDEACVVWIAAWRPTGPSPLSILLAFALFRVFDIAKPQPIGRSQNVGGGHGIVLDDALAGLFALALGLAVEAFARG